MCVVHNLSMKTKTQKMVTIQMILDINNLFYFPVCIPHTSNIKISHIYGAQAILWLQNDDLSLIAYEISAFRSLLVCVSNSFSLCFFVEMSKKWNRKQKIERLRHRDMCLCDLHIRIAILYIFILFVFFVLMLLLSLLHVAVIDVIIGSCPVRHPIVTCHISIIDAILGNLNAYEQRSYSISQFSSFLFSFRLSLDLCQDCFNLNSTKKIAYQFFSYFWSFDILFLSSTVSTMLWVLECLQKSIWWRWLKFCALTHPFD